MGEVTSPPLRTPEPLDNSKHDTADFQCRHAALNDWLKQRADKAEGLSARTYVVGMGTKVVGYYSLATAAIERENAPSAIRRNMPNPSPAMLLGRLAVDTRFEQKGIGSGLLKDALLRTLQAAQIAGVRALIVHAIDEDARKFYVQRGFREFPSGSRTLFFADGNNRQSTGVDSALHYPPSEMKSASSKSTLGWGRPPPYSDTFEN